MLIRSKLERPPLPGGLVPRPRLLDRLRAAPAAHMTLIVAPAGYGKTTAALQWLENVGGDAAWISLDRADRNPQRFARYLVAALGGVSGAGFEACRALLDARTPPPWSYVCDTLVAELDSLSEQTFLALEDYHEIDSPDIHHLVELMVERSPQALHIAVMTRVDPPWPLTRWRAQGWLAELRAGDLRFSVEETAQFFASVAGLTLSPTTVESLQRRTEGWIAGLRLAQLSLSESPDPDRDGRELSGTDRQIADYLIDEVLAAQPPEVFEFLAVSALMERFSAPLMAHLLAGRADAAEMRRYLSALETNNLFLVALDTRRDWYRWHHLFRDLLVDHLGHLVSSDFRGRLRREAGAWFAREGLVEEALRQWIPAGELDAAAALVGTHLHAVISEDMSCRRLAEWLSMFPPGAMHGRLPLLVAEGHCCMIRWNFPGLEAVLREIEGMGTDGSRKGSGGGAPFLQADIDALWAQLLYWKGDVGGSLERSQRALASNPEVASRPWSLACVYRLGGLVLSGRLHEGVRKNEEAIAAVGPGSPSAAELLQAQGFAHLYALDLGSCRARALQMLDLDERVSVANSRLGHAPYLLGLVAYEQNLLDEAETCFRRVEDLRYRVISAISRDALIGRALIALARNNQQAVDTYCRDARAFATEIGDANSLGVLRSFEVRVALLRGLPPPEGIGPPVAADHQAFWLEVPTVTWAMHLIKHPAAPVRASALDFVDNALVRMEQHHNRRVAVPLSILRALALHDRGDREAALDALADVVAMAAPRGLIRSFLDCGPRVKDLLDELARRPDPDAYVQTLRAAFVSAQQSSTALGPNGVLTFRELETLELLAWRMTNKEIASRLSVSSAAVKKRLDSIYAKLGVHDRRAAVAEAVSRRLIQPPAR